MGPVHREARIFARNSAVAAAAAVALAGIAAGTAEARPGCFGAASRDPAHRCHNPKLRKMVTPTRSQALLITSAPCQPTDAPIACTFGPPPSEAESKIALVGD